MGVISEEKVNSASIKFEEENGHSIWDEQNKIGGKPGTHLCITSFKHGVNFAETELQNLAIEFAEWLNNTYYLDETGYYVVSGKYISTFELFEVYKTIKNKLI